MHTGRRVTKRLFRPLPCKNFFFNLIGVLREIKLKNFESKFFHTKILKKFMYASKNFCLRPCEMTDLNDKFNSSIESQLF